ncbi:MAG: hypothetical protein ACXWCO_20805 [Caldimonas sp.]
MNEPGRSRVERPLRALLELVQSDRDRQRSEILGEAESRAATLQAQAHAEARARMVRAFQEQRSRRREGIAAAEARLATQRRLHEQQRTAALLRHAWEQLPNELRALWQEPDARASWVRRVLASARERLPPGPWRIVHAADWEATQHEAFADGTEHRFEADPAIAAGLKVVADGNVIDGTLEGLLADRADFETRLLRALEERP